jgi:UDP-glucose:(heptosyl)LPS alpha-1,3-glucosyltransferase
MGAIAANGAVRVNIAFCIFKYFPFGGMQQNFRAILDEALRRGHRARVYAGEWQGPDAPDCELVLVPRRGASSHARARHFTAWVQAHLREHPLELVLGFNKMPGLDVYYAADGCEAQRLAGPRGRLLRGLPRYRHLLACERSVFAPGAGTRVMFISVRQQEEYLAHYRLAPGRHLLLPPGVARNHVDPAQRQRVRAGFGLDDAHQLLLAVGSGFRTKGLERTLHALARLDPAQRQHCLLLVVGQDKAAPFERLARRLGVAAQLRFLGGRRDVPELLCAADLLLHPALAEAAGMVLLEAACAGLPVLASAACGFASYVREHDFGVVLDEPFEQRQYEAALSRMLGADATRRQAWRDNGLRFAARADIHDRPRHAVDHLEQAVRA